MQFKKNPLAMLLSFAAFLGAVLHINPAMAGFDMRPPGPGYSSYSINLQMQPGETTEKQVVVTNTGDEPVTLNIYAADGTTTKLGTFALTFPSDEQRTIGKWVTLESSQITVEARGSRTVGFTIMLPDNTPPGSYSGGIAAETIPEGNTQEMGVSTIERTITPVYVGVPGEKIHQFDWEDFSHSESEKGDHMLNLTFSNTGNTTVIVKTKIQIFGLPDGIDPEVIEVKDAMVKISDEEQKTLDQKKAANTLETYEITVLSGQSISIPLAWKLKPLYGNYTAKAQTFYWEYDHATGQKINPTVLSKETHFSVIPWNIIWLIILFILIILSIPAGIFLHTKAMMRRAVSYTVLESETLMGIAKKTGIHWKLIARINQLRPPFELKKGQIILIPTKKAKRT